MKGEQMMLYKRVAMQTKSVETAPWSLYKGVSTAIGGLIRIIKPLVVILIVATAAKTANAYNIPCGPVGSDVALPSDISTVFASCVAANNLFANTGQNATTFMVWGGPTTTEGYLQQYSQRCDVPSGISGAERAAYDTQAKNQLFAQQYNLASDKPGFVDAANAGNHQKMAQEMGLIVSPTTTPTPGPTTNPTNSAAPPTGQPSTFPTPGPTQTAVPTNAPTQTAVPTNTPTHGPTRVPSTSPTRQPSETSPPVVSPTPAPQTQVVTTLNCEIAVSTMDNVGVGGKNFENIRTAYIEAGCEPLTGPIATGEPTSGRGRTLENERINYISQDGVMRKTVETGVAPVEKEVKTFTKKVEINGTYTGAIGIAAAVGGLIVGAVVNNRLSYVELAKDALDQVPEAVQTDIKNYSGNPDRSFKVRGERTTIDSFLTVGTTLENIKTTRNTLDVLSHQLETKLEGRVGKYLGDDKHAYGAANTVVMSLLAKIGEMTSEAGSGSHRVNTTVMIPGVNDGPQETALDILRHAVDLVQVGYTSCDVLPAFTFITQERLAVVAAPALRVPGIDAINVNLDAADNV